MKQKTFYFLILSLLILCNCTSISKNQNESLEVEKDTPARTLIKKVCAQTGTYNDLKKLNNVEYTYTIHAVNSDVKNVSKERYIFDGELSWAQYLPQDQLPIKTDTTTQFFDGNKVTLYTNQEKTTKKSEVEFAGFVRRTNFYWFTMMQKLLDPGVNHKLLDSRMVNSTNYKIVEMTFDDGIGVVQDKYLLYINPDSYLIDQFLFTVKDLDFAPDDPLLMQVEYSTVNGLKIMSQRSVRQSTWDGKADGLIIYQQSNKNIKFNNDFDASDFFTFRQMAEG